MHQIKTLTEHSWYLFCRYNRVFIVHVLQYEH